MNSRPSEGLKALCEIAALALDRMNSGTDIAPAEAFTLGQISGTAMRLPGVIQYLKEREQGKPEMTNFQGQGFSRPWPPGVHGNPNMQED